MKCPDDELLSAYADREAGLLERFRVRRHAASCPRCRAGLKLASRMKAELAAAPVPAMPEALARALEGMLPVGPGPVPARSARPLSAALAFAAACAALLMLARRDRTPAAEDVALDELVAAHESYSGTLPLAQAGTLLAELPEELVPGGGR